METITSSARTIYNPVQQDSVTFLKTAAETGGKFTLIECTVAPGGGVGTHFHRTFEESFEVVDGILTVEIGKARHRLFKGDRMTAPRHATHRFYNDTALPCTFLCWISPGSKNFEAALQIGYGLARDGETRNGLPRDPSVLAFLMQLSETNLPGWRAVFGGVFRWLARRFVAKGFDKNLFERYVELG